jgi:subtilase family serine protease
METKRAIFIKSAAAIATLIVLMLASPRVSITQTSLNERITGAIDERSRSVVPGHLHPLARPQFDQGRLSPVRTLHRITMMFKRTDAQQRNLAALLEEQQNPASPNYHRWLSPEEFADRFGLSSADLDKIATWLQNQGFIIDDTARSRSWITFSGTVQQVHSAFNTEMHEYLVDATRHYAAVTEPSVPTAMGDVVLGFGSLNDFHLKPRVKSRKVNFTSNISGNHFLTPDDLATIYNVRPLYSAGLDGTGQKIAVMGQTSIIVSDILTFRSASGLPVTPPTMVLVPGSTDPGINPDDLGEADLDLEWAGALAPNAEIVYVNSGNGVFDSLQYSIGQNLAPAISISYGACERNFSRSDLNLLGALAQQANAQGITISAAAGDSGATDCDGDFTDRQLSTPRIDGRRSSQSSLRHSGWRYDFLRRRKLLEHCQQW